MILEWWFVYLLISIILSLLLGFGVINIMIILFNYGYCGVVVFIVGFQIGLVIYIVLVGVGLGMLFFCLVIVFEVLKWVGVVYLIWLGIQQWCVVGVIDFKLLVFI